MAGPGKERLAALAASGLAVEALDAAALEAAIDASAAVVHLGDAERSGEPKLYVLGRQGDAARIPTAGQVVVDREQGTQP